MTQHKQKTPHPVRSEREAKARRACRGWGWLLGLVLILLVAVGAFRYFTSDAFLRPRIRDGAGRAIAGSVEIGRVELRSLYDFRMSGLRLQREHAEEPDIEIDSLRFDLNPWAFFGGGVELRGGAVSGARVHASFEDGKLSLAGLAAPRDPDRPPIDQDLLARQFADGVRLTDCEVSLRHPGLFKDDEPRRIAGLNGTWRRGATSLNWHHLEAEVTEPPLRGLRVQGWIKADRERQVRLRAEGDNIRITPELIALLPADLQEAMAPFDPRGWAALEATADLAHGEEPAFGVKLGFSGADFTLPMNAMPVDAADGQFSMVPGAANFSLTSGFLFDGVLQGMGAIRFQENGARPIRASLSFSEVDLAELLGHVLPGEAPPPGKLSGSLNLAGDLNAPKQLSAVGETRLRDAYLVRLPLVASLFSVMNLSLSRTETVREGEVLYHFDFERERLHIDRVEMRSRNVEISGRGWIGFDGTIDMQAVVALPERVDRGILAPLRRVFRMVVGGVQRIVTPPYRITGTLENPRFRPMAVEHVGAPITSLFDIFGFVTPGQRDE